jgi:lipopolysaccharide heptosyltransferase I
MSLSPKILIIRLSSLGDILHVIPAFSALRAKFPGSSIQWLAAKKSEFLVRSIRGIDTIHILDTEALTRTPFDGSAWNGFWSVIRRLRAERFDIGIDFQGLLKTSIIGLLSGSKTRIGFAKEIVRERPSHWFYQRTLEKPANPIHIVEQNQMLAALAGADPVDMSVDLTVPISDSLHIDSLLSRAQLERYVVLNPGGGWATKCWAPDRYGKLAQRIQRGLGMPVIVTTGPGEEGLYRKIAEACGDPVPSHFPVSFIQLIPLYKKAHLFIGGDTGPFHLACALGTPVVGIFGPTSPVRNGPWNKNDVVLHHALQCSNCYGRTCPAGNECMNIDTDEVFSAVTRRLALREDLPIVHA